MRSILVPEELHAVDVKLLPSGMTLAQQRDRLTTSSEIAETHVSVAARTSGSTGGWWRRPTSTRGT